MRNAFVDAISKICRERDDMIILSGDAGMGVFDQFAEDCPEKFFNTGIAEQNAISMAAGMALSGMKVVAYNIVPFVLYRCFEQVRNDVCYQELPVILVGVGSGLSYSASGMTHYSVEDLGLCQTLPNLQVYSPIDPVSARLMAQKVVDSDKPCYVRLAKRGEPDLLASDQVDVDKPIVMSPGKDVAILFHGSIAPEAVAAKEQLTSAGQDPMLIAINRVQPLDWAQLWSDLGDIKRVIVVEEQFVSCGLAARLMQQVMLQQLDLKVEAVAIQDQYIHQIKNQASMRAHFGIDAKAVVETIQRHG